MVVEKVYNHLKETSVNIVQTEIKSVRKKDISKTGIRVYDNGLIGSAGIIGNQNEELLLEQACKSLQNKIPYNCDPTQNSTINEKRNANIPTDNNFVEEIGCVLEVIKKDQPKFSFSNKIYIAENNIAMNNDLNLDLRYSTKQMGCELIFKDKLSANLFDGFVGFEGRNYDRQQLIKLINDTCNAFSNKVDLPKNETCPVIFYENEAIVGKLLNDLNGNAFGLGSSLLADKLGEKVFSDKFTLYQDNQPDNLNCFFDAEGTVNEGYKYALIKNGIIKSPYTDKKTSKLYNLPLTGSACANYDSVPNLGAPNICFEQSNKSLKQLLGGDKGILVLLAAGGDFTPDGNFATPVQLAFLFDGDKLIGRLPEFNLSSNVFNMFGKDFRGVGNNYITPLYNIKNAVIDMKIS